MNEKDFVKKSKDAISHVQKLLKDWNSKVSKDIGRVNVRFKEGSIIKKAKFDLANGLRNIAKTLEESAKKIK